MTLKDLETRIDQLVAQAEKALANARRSFDPYGSSTPAMRPEEWAGLRAAALAFIELTFGREHSYYGELDTKLRESWDYNGQYALGVLTAIRGPDQRWLD